jgi:hypothetical protein
MSLNSKDLSLISTKSNGNITSLSEMRGIAAALLNDLLDQTKETDLRKVRAFCEVSNTIVNTLRVEIEFIKLKIHEENHTPTIPFIEGN